MPNAVTIDYPTKGIFGYRCARQPTFNAGATAVELVMLLPPNQAACDAADRWIEYSGLATVGGFRAVVGRAVVRGFRYGIVAAARSRSVRQPVSCSRIASSSRRRSGLVFG